MIYRWNKAKGIWQYKSPDGSWQYSTQFNARAPRPETIRAIEAAGHEVQPEEVT